MIKSLVYKKYPSYDGSSFKDFRIQFDIVTEFIYWNIEIMAQSLLCHKKIRL